MKDLFVLSEVLIIKVISQPVHRCDYLDVPRGTEPGSLLLGAHHSLQWHTGRESPCRCRRPGGAGSIPGSRRCPGGGNGNPLQDSCLPNPRDRGAQWATVCGVTKVRQDWTTEHTQHNHCSRNFWPEMTWAFHLYTFGEKYDAEGLTCSLHALLHEKSGLWPLHHWWNLPGNISTGSHVPRNPALSHRPQLRTHYEVFA